jgi:hypothetical protein
MNDLFLYLMCYSNAAGALCSANESISARLSAFALYLLGCLLLLNLLFPSLFLSLLLLLLLPLPQPLQPSHWQQKQSWLQLLLHIHAMLF